MSRELALEQELKVLEELNSSVDMLLGATETVSQNVTECKKATDNTSALLADWVGILNQTKFTNSALRNPRWKGSSGNYTEKISRDSHKRTQIEAEILSLETESEGLVQKLDSAPASKQIPKRNRR